VELADGRGYKPTEIRGCWRRRSAVSRVKIANRAFAAGRGEAISNSGPRLSTLGSAHRDSFHGQRRYSTALPRSQGRWPTVRPSRCLGAAGPRGRSYRLAIHARHGPESSALWYNVDIGRAAPIENSAWQEDASGQACWPTSATFTSYCRRAPPPPPTRGPTPARNVKRKSAGQRASDQEPRGLPC
jgi:hypothetical protein